MLLTRGRYFLVHKQTKYWGVFSLIFALYIREAAPLPVGFGKHLTISSQTLPALIVMFAIGATSVWSYWFLLVPILRRTFKAENSLSSIAFQALFFASGISSLVLFAVYGYAVVVSDVHTQTQQVLDNVFAQIGPVGSTLYAIHLILFADIYTLSPLSISGWSDTRASAAGQICSPGCGLE